MAELDVRTAALQSITMTRYVEGFTREMIEGFGEKNAREFLGQALDHLLETAAMLGNVSDRLAEQGKTEGLVINAAQLRSALEFVAPDFDTDEDQREQEVVIQCLPARTSTEGEPMEAGLYCWLADYPEEGCIPLREDEQFTPLASHTGEAEPAAAMPPLLMQDENSGRDGRRYNEWHASRPDARLNAREAAQTAATPAAPGEVTDEQVRASAYKHCFKASEMAPQGEQLYLFDLARIKRLCAALSNPAPVAAPPSVPQAIDQLVSTLAESKGWMRDYARALIEDAIDRRHLEVAAPAPASEVVAWEATSERYLADIIDRAPEPLRRLGEWLSLKLDEDDWKTAERYVLGAMESIATPSTGGGK